MHLTIDELNNQVVRYVNEHDFHEALSLIAQFTLRIVQDEIAVGQLFASPLLDNLCQEIGARILAKKDHTSFANGKHDADVVCYLATKLLNTGGHTAVIEDLIRCQETSKTYILLTNFDEDLNLEQIRKRFTPLDVEIRVLPSGSLDSKVASLQLFLSELRPEKIFLFNNHHDSVAIAGIQPNLASKLFFYHHCDHQLCLGVFLPYATHIDPHPQIFNVCREKLDINNNVYLPLSSKDLGNRPDDLDFYSENNLTTCTSGNWGKFSRPYLYSYEDTVIKILEITKGKHIHVGPLPSFVLDRIRDKLTKNNLPQESFVNIEHVNSVWLALHKNKVDLYLDSFPIGGGKAVIEAMGAGMPIAVHKNYRSLSLTTYNIVYPEAFCWQNLEELYTILSELNIGALKQHSYYSRTYYEEYHTYEKTIEGLSEIFSGQKSIQNLKTRSYSLNELQTYIDLQNYQEQLYEGLHQARINSLGAKEIIKLLGNKFKKKLRKLVRQ